mmetsp:Transcript_2038/g.7612  ORF Transcript_2038/g.7612 Transcript_2038/m.7612 type:complete len:230 (+) Transcript_2038:102-791(+)
MQHGLMPTGVEPVDVDCAVFYVRSSELTPLESSNVSISDLLCGIQSVEWTNSCSALLSVRRLVRFHQKFLEPYVAEILQACLKQAKNLRSVVSKTALLCVSDLLQLCESNLLFLSEESMRSCLQTLLEISICGKKFLAVESDSVLQDFMDNSPACNIARICLHEVEHNSPAYRSALVRVVLCLLKSHARQAVIKETIASLWGEKLKELVRDQLPATRENARAALSLIMS